MPEQHQRRAARIERFEKEIAAVPGLLPLARDERVTNRTAYPYLGFCMVTLCLLALSAGGARSALLARVPVRLGLARLGRFPTLFLLFGLAMALPPVIYGAATHLSGYPVELLRPPALVGLYALVAGYAAFLFAVALLMAMLTTNPYSATGWSFIVRPYSFTGTSFAVKIPRMPNSSSARLVSIDFTIACGRPANNIFIYAWSGMFKSPG